MSAEVPIQQELGEHSRSGLSLAQQLYKGDPVLWLVKGKWHISTIWLVIVCFAGSAAFNFGFTSAFLGDYRPFASVLDALDLLLLTLAFTSIVLINLLLPTFMADIFSSLRTNGIIGPYRQAGSHPLSYEQFLDRLVAWVNSKWWLAAIAMLVALDAIDRLLMQTRYLHIPLFWRFFGFFASDVPLIYIASFFLIRIVLLTVFLNRLFHLFTIQVKPLHSDGSGGLGALGHILWISAAMMFALTLIILAVTQRLSSPLNLIFVTSGYSVLVFALVIGWLALPHRAMLQARNELLRPLTDEYERAITETMPSVSGDTATIVAGTERLSALQDRYKLLRDNFPVWPLEIMQMRRLALALILPALLSLLPSLLGLFTK